MKKRPEADLLNDVFPKGLDFRAAMLEQTLSSVRQQRQRRKAVRIIGVVAVCLSLSFILLNPLFKLDRSASQVAIANPTLVAEPKFPTVPGTSIRILSDEELLTLFANRPVALAGPPEDRQFIVLDEIQKNNTHTLLN